MSVADIYEKRATFSFEVFPPKTDVGMEKLCGKDGVLDKLYTLQPSQSPAATALPAGEPRAYANTHHPANFDSSFY